MVAKTASASISSVPKGVEIVDNAFKLAHSFQNTKKGLEGEIERLKGELARKDCNKNYDDDFKLLKYNEGALWLGYILNSQ